MKEFRGTNRRSSYFEGWYLKQQNDTDVVALIPAFHMDCYGNRKASLQVITREQSWNIEFPVAEFAVRRHGFGVRLGKNIFMDKGCSLDYRGEELTIRGKLRFGKWRKPAYGMMGPFGAVPGMACRHEVFSLSHTVNGVLFINGKKYAFCNGQGYVEGDRGTSFPETYLWTQCSMGRDCLMLASASVRVPGKTFTGCLGSLYLNEKEHRIATYLGARVLYQSEKALLVRQGDWKIFVKLLEERPQLLYAPRDGSMERKIRESAQCRVKYKVSRCGRVVSQFISEKAGFECN